LEEGTRYLADKSALARVRIPEVDAVITPLLRDNEIGVCSATQLEILYSALGYNAFQAIRYELDRIYPLVPTLQADFDRAIDVMEELSRRGRHRSVGSEDLIIAAVAERARLTVLHYASDYDYVAAVTGQPMEWVVPRGTVA